MHGSTFAHYDILRKLGRGMNDVYLASDSRSSRRVVLKIVERSGDALTGQVLAAERRGAAIQKQLHDFDPRVIEIYETGDFEDYFYISMEYVEGKNAAEMLAEGRLEPRRAAAIGLEVADQLSRLHTFRADLDGDLTAVVHGDIKPSNIQVALDGSVRLLDFGIAKAINLRHKLTHHNFGSPSYCSPERLANGRVDPQADLWALGVTLYEMVTSQPPYQAGSTRKLEDLIQSRRPPRALPANCPKGLRMVIQKTLAGDASRRYPSAEAIRDDLRLFLDGKITRAEGEARASWNLQATVESARAAVAKCVDFTRQWERAGNVTLGAGCLLLGLVVFLVVAWFRQFWVASAPVRGHLDYARRTPAEIAAGWDLYRQLQAHNAFLGRFSPASLLDNHLHAGYLQAADAIIDGYRTSGNPSFRAFDWRKAHYCLERALEMDPQDSAARGKLALCRGYAYLGNAFDWKGANRGPILLWQERARQCFGQAAAALPRAPDPHLALARLHAYLALNPEQVMAEMVKADDLGYEIGPREIEQEADAYRLRARQELAEAKPVRRWPRTPDPHLALARRDREAARGLYEGIRGYSMADLRLRQMAELDTPARRSRR